MPFLELALSAFRLNEAFKKEPNIPVEFLVWRKFAEWYNWLRGKLHFKRFEAIERVVLLKQNPGFRMGMLHW